MNNREESPVRVDLSSAPYIKCDACGDMRFETVYLIKKLSALMSPTGKEEIIPLGPPIMPPIFACMACGHINEGFLPLPLRADLNKKKEEIKQSALITDSTSTPHNGPTLVRE